MTFFWVGPVGFVRGLVTRCLVFQCTGGLCGVRPIYIPKSIASDEF